MQYPSIGHDAPMISNYRGSSGAPPHVAGTGAGHHARLEETIVAETATRPTETQVKAFVDKMRAYRDTLPEDEQRLLNSMFLAALGKQEGKEEEVHSYWDAYPTSTFYGSSWGTPSGAYDPRLW